MKSKLLYIFFLNLRLIYKITCLKYSLCCSCCFHGSVGTSLQQTSTDLLICDNNKYLVLTQYWGWNQWHATKNSRNVSKEQCPKLTGVIEIFV